MHQTHFALADEWENITGRSQEIRLRVPKICLIHLQLVDILLAMDNDCGIYAEVNTYAARFVTQNDGSPRGIFEFGRVSV